MYSLPKLIFIRDLLDVLWGLFSNRYYCVERLGKLRLNDNGTSTERYYVFNVTVMVIWLQVKSYFFRIIVFVSSHNRFSDQLI